MKKNFKRTFLLGLLCFVFLFAFAFTACDTDDNPPTPDVNTMFTFTERSDGTYMIEKKDKDSIPYGELIIPSTYKGKSVTVIPQDGFRNTSITSLTIPDSIITIAKSAFVSCYNLTSVTMASSVKSIDNQAFDNCDKLTTITYEGTIEQWNAIKKGNWKGDKLITIQCTDGSIQR